MSTQTPGGTRLRSGRTPGPAGAAVGRVVERLQRDYLGGSASARASLAHLRHALGKPVGSVPEVWDLTVGAVGPVDGDPEEPTAAEFGAHHALTLYALHQQAQSAPMHRVGVGLGDAVRQLNRSRSGAQGGESPAVRRRFDAVVTAGSREELVRHLRGLVQLFRQARVALDYALLADDLVRLQDPAGARAVRLRWARQYHRSPEDADGGTAVLDEPSPLTAGQDKER